MTCAELAEDLVAHALGQLPPDRAARVEAHTASCGPCRDDLDAAVRLFGAARAVPMPEPAAGAEERLFAAIRAGADREAAEIPLPAARRRRVRRTLSLVLPLAAAASILVAIVVTGREHAVRIVDGEGLLYADGDTAVPGRRVGDGVSEFRLRDGDELAAGAAPFSVRLTLGAGKAAPAAGRPAPGSVELTLAPGARLVRRNESEIELVAGRIDVAAGPLAEPFVVRVPPAYATIRGTRFSASTSESRLVVAVHEGAVEIGVAGGHSTVLEAGQEGLVDADRLLTRAADGHRAGQGFLTPRARLRVDPGADGKGPPRLVATLEEGEGGAVSILPFDDSEPRFLLRLKGDDGREREVKLQRAMLVGAPPDTGARTFRLTRDRGYELTIDPAALGVDPGRYETRLRYMSYRARSDGAEWLGVVKSDPLPIEVPAR